LCVRVPVYVRQIVLPARASASFCLRTHACRFPCAWLILCILLFTLPRDFDSSFVLLACSFALLFLFLAQVCFLVPWSSLLLVFRSFPGLCDVPAPRLCVYASCWTCVRCSVSSGLVLARFASGHGIFGRWDSLLLLLRYTPSLPAPSNPTFTIPIVSHCVLI
jgi:hypothetical protein